MKTLTTLFLTALSSVMLAQIPNPGFENWTSGTPNGWATANADIPGGITQSSTAHSGSSSLSVNSVDIFSYYFGGIISTGASFTGDSYFPNAGNPAALNGWYQLTTSDTDELTISVHTECGGGSSATINGFVLSKITTASAVWKAFSACLVYGNGCTADSADITFELTNPNGTGATHNGSFALIDDIAWGTCVAGVEDIGNNVTLESAYPNPASTICNIVFSIPSTSSVNVALYDLNGRKVMNLLDNTTLTDGKYKVPVDVHTLANGVYAYTILVDGVPYTQKLVVAK